MDNKLLEISKIAGNFKRLKHSGWIQHHATADESVADHSWGLSFLVMMYTPAFLNKLKCLELSVIHDLAETEVGDITPSDNIAPAEKLLRGTKAMNQIAVRLNEPYFLDLFNELETQQTPEAQFVKELDKIEVVLQAYYFVSHGFMEPSVYQEYYNTSKGKIHLPYLIELFNKIVPDYHRIALKRGLRAIP